MAIDQDPPKLTNDEIRGILGSQDPEILHNVEIPLGVVFVTANLKDGLHTVDGALGPAVGNVLPIKTTAVDLAGLIKSGSVYGVRFSR